MVTMKQLADIIAQIAGIEIVKKPIFASYEWPQLGQNTFTISVAVGTQVSFEEVFIEIFGWAEQQVREKYKV